jgi:zinc-ribbon domain
MSASAPVAEPCPTCGETLPVRARFCPSCGTELDEPTGSTVRAPVPADETGPVPVSIQRVEPRLFGVAPQQLLLALAATALVIAIALFATGAWPYGLILLGIGALLLAAFLEAARHRPSAAVRRAADARERAHSAWETWQVRAASAAEVRRIQSALAVLESDRRSALLDLGAAAHRGDSTGEATARAALGELDHREAQLRAGLEAAVEDAGERIRKARLPVEDTMMVLPTEPSPPPDEGTPPEPARVPEPYPPPDEATPPQPAQVPEPGVDEPER